MRNLLYVALALASSALLVQGQDLTVNVDTTRAPDLAEFGQQMKAELELWYPYFRNIMWTPEYVEPGSITLQFRELQGVTAYTYPGGNRIVASIASFRQALSAQGSDSEPAMDAAKASLIHELIHIIQQYRHRDCPGWFYEGYADYWTFYTYQPANPPTKPMYWAGQHYTQGYRPAAYFLRYMDDDINFGVYEMAKTIHVACRAGNYTEDIFENTLMGKTQKDVWEQMIWSTVGDNKKVVLKNIPANYQEQAEKLRKTMEEMYDPLFSGYMYSPKFEDLDVIFLHFNDNEQDKTQAYPGDKAIDMSTDQFQLYTEQEYTTRVLVAMVNLLQQYKVTEPSWLISGIAHLSVRNQYDGVAPQLLAKPPPTSHYTDGDWVTAYFLNWLNTRFQPHGFRLSFWLNRSIREGTYTDNEFRRHTGRTPQMLWTQMMAS